MKCYDFLIEITSVGKGYVYADNVEEAKKKINNGDFDDIYDEVEQHYGEIIEIIEAEAEDE